MLGRKWKLKTAMTAVFAGLIIGVLAFVVLFIGSGSVSPTCTTTTSDAQPVSIGGASWAQNIDHLYPRVMIGQTGAVLPPDVIAALAESAGKTLGINVPGWTMEQVTLGESSRRPGSFGNDPNGITSGWGLWAITTTFNDSRVAPYGGYPGMLNPIANALVMAEIYQSQGIGAWYGSEYVTNWDKHYTGPLPLVNLKDLLQNSSSGTTFVSNQTTSNSGQCSTCASSSTQATSTAVTGVIKSYATTYTGSQGSGGSLTGGYYFSELGTSPERGQATFATAHRLGDLFFQHKGAPPTVGGDAGTAKPLPYGAQVEVIAPDGRTLVVTKRDIGSGAPDAAIDLTSNDAQALGLSTPSKTEVTLKLISLHGGTGSGNAAGGAAGTTEPVSYTGSSDNSATGAGSCSLDVSTVPGDTAKILPAGVAVPPANAPPIIQQAIEEGNRIIHATYDQFPRGPLNEVLQNYDCSGGSAFVLFNTKYGGQTLDGTGVNSGGPASASLAGNSVSMAAWGQQGQGHWLTVWTGVGGEGHEFLEIAGIQLDTAHYGGNNAPVTSEGANLPGDAGPGTGPRWEPHSGLAEQLADGMAWTAHNKDGL